MDGSNHQEDNITENDNGKMEGTIDDNSDIEEYDDADYDDEGHFEFNKNTFERLKKNDPAIKSLFVQLGRLFHNDNGKYLFFNSINWKEDGDCITNNTHIKDLHIGYEHTLGEEDGEGSTLPTRQQLQDFFSCVYRNRSITQLDTHTNIYDGYGWSLFEGLRGHPSITKVQVDGVKIKWGIIGYKVFGKVLNHPSSKLKDLCLIQSKLDDKEFGLLCDELLGNSMMKKLDLTHNKQITSVGWQAFSSVLHHPNCKLVQLDLFCTVLNDDAANVLGTALSGCSSLKDLNLGYNVSITSAGWKALLIQLSHSTIVNLKLYSNKIDDAGIALLANIGTLKSLNLGSNRSITPAGWWFFFSELLRRGIQLKELNISYTKVGDVGIAALGTLLSSSMSTLKALILNGISHVNNDESDTITSQGWQTLFTALQHANLDLVNLDLGSNQIDNDGIQRLVQLVSNMSSLKCLSLSDNRSVLTGWQALSGYLQSPNLALRELGLNENNIDDDTLIILTSALVDNKSLKYLSLDGTWDDDTEEYISLITERGWGAVSTLLCNKASIMDTYSSNHTLQEISEYIRDDLLESYLELNRNKDKAEVARQKVLQTHFSTDEDNFTSNIQEFLDMEFEMMPTAISWMGKPANVDWKGKNVSGLSLMFNLMRRVPDLFDSGPQKKKPLGAGKRKRVA